jgi:hypothetical protein
LADDLPVFCPDEFVWVLEEAGVVGVGCIELMRIRPLRSQLGCNQHENAKEGGFDFCDVLLPHASSNGALEGYRCFDANNDVAKMTGELRSRRHGHFFHRGGLVEFF